jgi:cytochrome c oxidase subunit 3
VKPSETHSYRIAIWVLVASEALLFAGLFGLYTGLRAEYPQAFAQAVGQDVQILASFAVAWSLHLTRKGDDGRKAGWWLLLALLLGTAFAALKLTEYSIHIRDGIYAGKHSTGPYFGHGTQVFYTLYYLMTGLHLFHLVVGIALVVWMLVLARRRSLGQHLLALELVGVYWNFVDMVWFWLWPMFYLMRT